MVPPAKRRRRNIVDSSPEPSENENENGRVSGGDVEQTPRPKRRLLSDFISSSPPQAAERQPIPKVKASQVSKPVAKKTRAKTANHPSNAAPIYLPSQVRGSKSASSSPEKPKRKGKTEEKGRNADIFTFFTKQAQRQQIEGGGGATTFTKQKLKVSSSKEHALDDDIISDDDEVADCRAQSASLVGKTAKQRSKASDTFVNGDSKKPSASQAFIKSLKPPTVVKTEDDLRPWAERFAPMNLDELAVHKRKVGDVRTWLEEVMNGRMRQRLLILKGAAGTGKTTTVQLLAKSMDCDVLEWRNPVGSVAAADGFQSMTAQFEEFMGRGGKFGQLDLFSADVKPSKPEIKPLDRRKQIILVEEFPNTFTRSSDVLQSFRSTILQYLASNTPPLSVAFNKDKDPITPVVMIISETLLTTTSASADSFTAHRLLGPEVLQHPGVGIIEFNAIAPTFLAKALELVVQKESRKSGRKKTPGPLVLKKLGEVGDIRSAVGSLEFMCLRGDTNGDWGAKVAFGKGKKPAKDSITLTRMEEESLELITRREASLGIFHAVGKVVYNKRDETASSNPNGALELLPDHMAIHRRPKRSQISVDELIDETGTDTSTFVAALHENYLLSCDASPSSFDFSSLDHVNGCIDALSDSDLLCPSWNGSFNSSGFGGGAGGRGTGGDILRQDEISFQIAVRGLLFSLPNPVKRKAPAAAGLRTGKGGDAFKMFYPTSLKLWRQKEEIESTIDLWVARMMKGEEDHFSSVTSGAAAFARSKPGTVESWKPRNHNPPSKGPTNPEESTPLLSIGTSARKEMLLERLPYMVLIAKASTNPTSAFAIREMEKVTEFRGIGVVPSEESPDEGEDEEIGERGENWATDRPHEGRSPKKKGVGIRGSGSGKGGFGLQQQKEQKLVLSDDDIEDD